MEILYSLIHSLTPNETQLVKKFLSCFASREGEENTLSLKLFDYLQSRSELPEAETCCIYIYGTPQKAETFVVLKHRLKEKILDLLLTDISDDKQKDLDEADYAIVKINKKSAQFRQLYFSKKKLPLLPYMLDEIILLAKEYEEYSILVEHLKLKKTTINWKKGKKEFEQINKEMEKYLEFNRMMNKAEHCYHELKLLSDYTSKPDDKKLNTFFAIATAELDGYYEQTKSAYIKYYHKFLELGFYQHRNNYSKARSVCLELLDVVMENKSVYRRQRLGVVYDNLSRCEFYLKDYTQAAKDAREAQKYFNAGSENYCIALEQEFYALFAMEKYEDAITMAEKMISSATRKELGEFRDAKYHYLLANALFKKERFREALNLLSQERELSADKAGWEIGRRTLKIMTLVEMNQLDEASLAVYSLKKFFSRTKAEAPISARDKIIRNLLLMAERKGFGFNLLNGGTDKYMEKLGAGSSEFEGNSKSKMAAHSQLKTPDSELKWEPFTHELFPFHEWFASKMKKPIPAPSPSKGKKKVVFQ
ncbi:MAG: hypothetical protein HY841_02835 [Bacteroidetes bacterium]|nr:hypothetical protein [Bacteroidota bacterium]